MTSLHDDVSDLLSSDSDDEKNEDVYEYDYNETKIYTLNFKPYYGIIYLKSHTGWDAFNAYKFGKTFTLYYDEQRFRSIGYGSGKYIMIITVKAEILDRVYKYLFRYLKKRLDYHIYYNAGYDFFNKNIEEHIIPYLKHKKIEHYVFPNNLLSTINEIICRNKLKNAFLDACVL
jgi:hypothetical protein